MLGQDVVVALMLVARPEEGWTHAALGSETFQSASQAHAAVRRLREARLVAPEGWAVRRGALLEFLTAGLPYTFPVEPKGRTLGVATAWSHAPVQGRLGLTGEEALAWPDRDGDFRGLAVAPLHAAVPRIARGDARLHAWFALVDCLRLGRARERRLAAEALEQDLLAHA